MPNEVVYDPACHDISLSPSYDEMDEASGWHLADTDGASRLWNKDMQGAAIDYLANKATHLRSQLDHQLDPPPSPGPCLGR